MQWSTEASNDDSSDVSDDSSDDVSHDFSDDVSSDVSDGDADGVTTAGDRMTMKFKMGKRRVKLELERNEYIPQLTYYYTAEKGGLVQWTLDQEQVYTHLCDLQVKLYSP